jgi:hypothetical protein
MRQGLRHGAAWRIPGAAALLILAFAVEANAQTQDPPQSQTQTQNPPGTQTQTQTQTQTSTPPQTQSQATVEVGNKTWGNYYISQSVEFGYRDSMINGNYDNYQTFVDLASGMRLFDYTLNLQSIDHQGIFFDNLSFSNFGYGGDPNSVSRLRIQKNKWYDFRAQFRRDKDFWDYNLLANPLNPTSTTLSNSIVAITNSPHALDLTRRMQDYDLTLLPQSKVRFRLGYSYNTQQGLADTTLEGGTDTELADELKYTTNSYRMGVDYVGLAKTTLSFDEYLTYSKIDDDVTDHNFNFQLANGTPVDLGIVFVGTTPCASPITNSSTTPPTVTPNCNGYLSYSQLQNPRSSFPTERFAFQSSYVKNLAMTGAVSYSDDRNAVNDFDEVIDGWTSRTLTRESTTGGPTLAKRVNVNADWSGDYQITNKLSFLDQFNFMDWRIPAMWDTAETNLFGTQAQASGEAGMTLPIAVFTPADFSTICPLPYTAVTCPQHNSSSGADITDQITYQFLGQNIRSNTAQLKYDFTKRLSAYLGYKFTARTIQDFTATYADGLVYFPGGATAMAANDYLAARGDCALSSGVLPTGCVLNSNGSIQYGSPADLIPETGSDTARNTYEIHENTALLGINARPIDTLRLTGDIEVGYNDNSFTRISPRQVQIYKVHAIYNPAPWATVNGNVDIHENRDNVSMVNNIEHGRTYSFATMLTPNPKLWVDFGYNYMTFYTQTEICFVDTGSTVFTTANSPCPIPAEVAAGVPLGTLSVYSEMTHYAYGDVMWKPYKRVTAMLGYSGSFVRGTTTFLNALTPTGPLDFDYMRPTASLAVDIYRGLSYKTAWNYFGYIYEGGANPTGLAPLPAEGFNGNNVTFAMKYVF